MAAISSRRRWVDGCQPHLLAYDIHVQANATVVLMSGIRVSMGYKSRCWQIGNWWWNYGAMNVNFFTITYTSSVHVTHTANYIVGEVNIDVSGKKHLNLTGLQSHIRAHTYARTRTHTRTCTRTYACLSCDSKYSTLMLNNFIQWKCKSGFASGQRQRSRSVPS